MWPCLMVLETHVDLAAREEAHLSVDDATLLLEGALPLETLLSRAEIPRRRHFANTVRIHVLNNVKNGHCAEDCGYCAQRRTAPSDVPAYTTKPDEEILAEARRAHELGAFRYCLVQAGRGPGPNTVKSLARVIARIKAEYNLEVCLSAGILTDPQSARVLADSGLDRYNHNLNTSAEHYAEICTTHTFRDRIDTLSAMSAAGVRLCSGVIAGMGETPRDLAVACGELRRQNVVSIPVNLFIPVPGHAIHETGALSPEYCLRILSVFRLMNPRAELRLAAGRELHLGPRQPDALRVANSLFVSGYLNVQGSNAAETLGMINAAGYVAHAAGEFHSADDGELDQAIADFGPLPGSGPEAVAEVPAGPVMKDEAALRPFRAGPGA